MSFTQIKYPPHTGAHYNAIEWVKFKACYCQISGALTQCVLLHNTNGKLGTIKVKCQ